jgi:hypothetical protein
MFEASTLPDANCDYGIHYLAWMARVNMPHYPALKLYFVYAGVLVEIPLLSVMGIHPQEARDDAEIPEAFREPN